MLLLTGNRLTISGERAMTKEQTLETFTYYTHERIYGRFSRSFTLPEGADVNAVHAELKAGVLTVVFPKLPQIQPKKTNPAERVGLSQRAAEERG